MLPSVVNKSAGDVSELENLLAVASSSELIDDPADNELVKLLSIVEKDETNESIRKDDQLKESSELNQLLAATKELNEKPILVNRPILKDDNSFAEAFRCCDESSNILSEAIQRSKVASESLIKEQELDSSDDEEVKNFLERKYNEYGRDINKKLKQKNEEKNDIKIDNEVIRQINKTSDQSSELNRIFNGNKNVTQKTGTTSSFKDNVRKITDTNLIKAVSVSTDPVFGMRVVNPLVSNAMLVERMSGRKPISFANLSHHVERGDLTQDWVVAGVLLSKSPVKTSKKGDPFSIWKLSDLKGEIKTASLFLFRNGHKELWKTAVGTVIAILNPSVFEKREDRSDVACLSIDTSHKVVILGQSKDMGTCKAKKKNGEPCTSLVNLGDCEFCLFHVKSEYGKMSKRSELQSSTAGRGLNELMKKVLGKNEVFYAGQSFTAEMAKKSPKQTFRDKQRMMTLSEFAISPNASNVNHSMSPKINWKDVPYAKRDGPVSKIACSVEADAKQRISDLERLKVLKAETSKCSSSITSEEDCPTQSPQRSVAASSTTPAKFKNLDFSFSSKSPQLSRESFSIDINVSNKQAALSKLKAMEILKKKPLQKSNPNFIKYRGTTDGKKRAIDDLHEERYNEVKRRKVEEDKRELDRKTRLERIMAATSSHTNLIESKQDEEQEKYFNKLEKREAMEEKMLNTFKVPCKAVICIKCKYTAFSAADRCKEEKHPLKVVDTEKRFFQCKDCGNRTVSVHKIPKLSCKNCKNSRWERTAMIREKKPFDPKDGLSIRGDEEMWIGGCTGKTNLNLLVADE